MKKAWMQWVSYPCVWNDETLGWIKKWSGVSKQHGVSTSASSTQQS